MSIALYMDVHVPQAITDQLRKRGVDVLTAIEDHAGELADEALLQRAYMLKRVLFTQDIRFKALAQKWQQSGGIFLRVAFWAPIAWHHRAIRQGSLADRTSVRA